MTGRSPVNELALDAMGYPEAQNGTVWATYDPRQADVIRNALLAQHIPCELTEVKHDGRPLYLLRVPDARGSVEATDFIWRDASGLRLKPDWSYADGEINRSFEQWLSGH